MISRHPDPELRAEAAKYFLLMCMLPGNTTNPVLPLEWVKKRSSM